MGDTDSLLGARLKIERARQHLESLRHETRVFTETNPYEIVAKRDPQSGDHVVRIRYKRPNVKVPLRLSLIAGDIAHNLRSALDHLAVQLAIIGTGASRTTQFPIFGDEDDYRQLEDRHLRGIVKGHRTRIEALQPYHVGKLIASGQGLTGKQDPLMPNVWLMIVGRLDNTDKHRLLLPSIPFSPYSQPRFIGVKKAVGTYPAKWVRLEDGAELFRITELELLPGATEMKMEKDPAFTILFGDPELDVRALWADDTKGGATAADLAQAADAVQGVIDAFAPDFG